MRANRGRDTGPEIALRSALHRRGMRFRKSLRIELSGLSVRPDVIFTRARLAIFVDGCFWHRCPEHGSDPRANSSYWGPKLSRNVERDHAVNRALAIAGWTVIRVWEHESPARAAAMIAQTVESLKLDQTQR